MWSVPNDKKEIIKLSGKPPGLAVSALPTQISTSPENPEAIPASTAQTSQQATANLKSHGELPMNPGLRHWLGALRTQSFVKAGALEACQRGNRQEVRADLDHFFQTHAPAYVGQVLDQSFDQSVNESATGWNREQSCSDPGFSSMKQRVDSLIAQYKDRILQNLPPGAASLPAPPRPDAVMPQSAISNSRQLPATASAKQETRGVTNCPTGRHDWTPPKLWEEEKKDVQHYCSTNYTLSRYDVACCVEEFRQARLKAGPCVDFYNVVSAMHYTNCGYKH